MIHQTNASIRPEMAECFMEYMLNEGRFVGLKMLPQIGVKVKSAQYAKINREALLQAVNTARAANAAYPRISWEYGTGNFSCTENGVEQAIDDGSGKVFSQMSGFDAEEIATFIAGNTVMSNLECRIASLLFDEDVFTPVDLSASPWTAAGADALGHINTGKKAIRDATGLTANKLLIGYDVFLELQKNTIIIDRIKYSNAEFAKNGGQITRKLLTQLFDLDEVVVGDSVKNTANEGQDVVIGDIWNPNYGMLAVVNDSPNIKDPGIGRTFLWEEDSPDLITAEVYREEQTRSNVMRVRQSTDEQIILPEAGYLMRGLMGE